MKTRCNGYVIYQDASMKEDAIWRTKGSPHIFGSLRSAVDYALSLPPYKATKE